MKFEEALALMREGKTVLDPDGNPWKLENGEFRYCLPPDSCSPGWHYTPYLRDCDVLGEWTIREEPKFQYLWRHKGSTDWKSITTGKFASEEEALASFTYPERIEVRRIEP